MSELRSILADTITRLFTDRVTKDVLETAEQGQWPAALWQALEESGLTLPLESPRGPSCAASSPASRAAARARARLPPGRAADSGSA